MTDPPSFISDERKRELQLREIQEGLQKAISEKIWAETLLAKESREKDRLHFDYLNLLTERDNLYIKISNIDKEHAKSLDKAKSSWDNETSLLRETISKLEKTIQSQNRLVSETTRDRKDYVDALKQIKKNVNSFMDQAKANEKQQVPKKTSKLRSRISGRYKQKDMDITCDLHEYCDYTSEIH